MQSWIVIGVLIALILFNFFSHINIGPLSVLAALILGRLLLGLNVAQTAALVPAGTLLTLIALSAFYGFALENGTANALIQRILSRLGSKSDKLPLVIFAVSALLSAAGLGCGNTTLVMAPAAMSLAGTAAFSPLVMAAAVSCGAAAGGNFPFSYGGVIAASLIHDAGTLVDPASTVLNAAFRNFMVNAIAFLTLYIAKKGPKSRIPVQQAPPLNQIQRKTVRLITVVIFCTILPGVLALLFPCPFSKSLSNFLDTSTVMIAGVIAASALHLAPEREVLKKHVPWGLLVIISGMCMLIGIARKCGIIDLLGDTLGNSIPQGIMKYVLLLISMTMSLFAGAISVVVPSLYPIVPTIGGSAANTALYYGAILTGATCGGISPYSSGGMLILGAYPKEQGRRKLLLQLLLMPFYITAIAFIVYTI